MPTTVHQPSLVTWEGWRELLPTIWRSWNAHRVPQMGAALAYYTLFSLGPLLLAATGIASLIFEPAAVEAHVDSQLKDLLGEQGSAGVSVIRAGSQQESAGLWAAIVGAGLALFAAAGAFGQLQAALDVIWDSPCGREGGWSCFLRARLLPFAAVLGMGVLLLASLAASAALHAFTDALEAAAPGATVAVHLLDVLVSLGLVTLFFALVYRLLPQASVEWRHAWLGALAAGLLFTAGKMLLGWYLGRASFGSLYGAAGTLVVVLVWTYYSAQILLFGAEFTRASQQRAADLAGQAEPLAPIARTTA